MKIKLPQFKPNTGQRDRVKKEIETARFIKTLWNSAGQRKSDAKFISLLVRCGWVNNGKDESTRKWRNNNIAAYLKVNYESDEQLARELSRIFPRLKKPLALLRTDTGITHYRPPFRPNTIKFVERHALTLATIFSQISSTRINPDKKIRRAVERLVDLGYIRTSRGKISPLNGLTPTLACLDPTRQFPIVNVRTKRLLNVIGKGRDADGAVELSHLIGRNGIKNSFDLDVYSTTANLTKAKIQRKQLSTSSRSKDAKFRDVGLRSEINSFARIAASRKRMRKLHNSLTNRLHGYLTWRYTLQESEFDIVIPDWKQGRKLLIEAKTASDGPGGRTQIRQAIGQLFDYRHKFFHMEKKRVDLALLLSAEPSSDIRALMKSLHIEVIWFKGKKLEGTIVL